MTADKLYTSLSANIYNQGQTDHNQWTRLITPSTDKHYSLDSKDGFRSGCRNVSHKQQFFSEIPSPRLSHKMNYGNTKSQTRPTTTNHNCLSYLRLLDGTSQERDSRWVWLHGTTQELTSRAHVGVGIPHGFWSLCTRISS